jgi:hypothetical protein
LYKRYGANEEKKKNELYLAFIHHRKINGFLIGLNALEKNIYFQPIAIEYEGKRERERRKRKKAATRYYYTLKVIYKRSQTTIISS